MDPSSQATSPTSLKKLEKEFTKEGKAEEMRIHDAMKDLSTVEKAQVKAHKAVRKAESNLSKMARKESAATAAVQKANHKHDMTTTYLHTAENECERQRQHYNKLKEELNRKKGDIEAAIKEQRQHNQGREAKIKEFRNEGTGASAGAGTRPFAEYPEAGHGTDTVPTGQSQAEHNGIRNTDSAGVAEAGMAGSAGRAVQHHNQQGVVQSGKGHEANFPREDAFRGVPGHEDIVNKPGVVAGDLGRMSGATGPQAAKVPESSDAGYYASDPNTQVAAANSAAHQPGVVHSRQGQQAYFARKDPVGNQVGEDVIPQRGVAVGDRGIGSTTGPAEGPKGSSACASGDIAGVSRTSATQLYADVSSARGEHNSLEPSRLGGHNFGQVTGGPGGPINGPRSSDVDRLSSSDGGLIKDDHDHAVGEIGHPDKTPSATRSWDVHDAETIGHPSGRNAFARPQYDRDQLEVTNSTSGGEVDHHHMDHATKMRNATSTKQDALTNQGESDVMPGTSTKQDALTNQGESDVMPGGYNPGVNYLLNLF